MPFPRSDAVNIVADKDSSLLSIDDVLPPCFRECYPFSQFNRLQTRAFPIAYKSHESFVVSAPTASGKTVVLELALLNMLRSNVDSSGQYVNHSPGARKAIYLAPTRALVQEKKMEWEQRFMGSLNLQLAELTGDSVEDISLADIYEHDVILCTPEKLDWASRSSQAR